MPRSVAALLPGLVLEGWFRLRRAASWNHISSGSADRSFGIAERERLAEELVKWLRQILTQAPRWIGGHMHLAEESFRCGQIAACYASLQAVSVLDRSQGMRPEMKLLLAKCYVRRGALQQGERELRGILESNPDSQEAREELAAVIMADGREDEARTLLEGVTRLSPEAHAALAYLRLPPAERRVARDIKGEDGG